MTYQKVLDKDGTLIAIKRLDDGAFIPLAPENKDYQAVLEFQKNGGVLLDPVEDPIDKDRRLKLEAALVIVKDPLAIITTRLDNLLMVLGITPLI